MSEFAELGVVVRQAVDVRVVAGAEHLRGAETGAGFKEGLPVDGAGVGLDAENFDVEHLDARGIQVGFDFTNHRRVADHVVLGFGRRGRARGGCPRGCSRPWRRRAPDWRAKRRARSGRQG